MLSFPHCIVSNNATYKSQPLSKMDVGSENDVRPRWQPNKKGNKRCNAPRKINIWNPKWRFGSDEFPVQIGWFLGFSHSFSWGVSPSVQFFISKKKEEHLLYKRQLLGRFLCSTPISMIFQCVCVCLIYHLYPSWMDGVFLRKGCSFPCVS